MNLLKRHWLIASLIVVALAVFAAFRFKGSEQPKYFTTKVDRGNISQVVEATGTINAVTTVQVGSQVSGTISRLNADFNSRVKKGQVVAQIDPSLFQGSPLTGLVLALGRVKKSRRRKKPWRLAILCALLGLLVACGGGSSGASGGSGAGAGHPGTTPGNYTVTVTGAVGSVTRTADVVLIVE